MKPTSSPSSLGTSFVALKSAVDQSWLICSTMFGTSAQFRFIEFFGIWVKQHRKPRERGKGVFFLFSVVLQTSFHQQQIPADFGSGESRLWGRWIPCRLILTEIALTRSIAVLLTAIFRNPKMPLFIESTHFPNQSVEGRLCLKHIHTPSVETFITQKCW